MTAWPVIVARILELLPALDGWAGVEVYDGPPVTRDAPADYCTVGFVLDEDVAGSYEPTDSIGDLREESGSVRSEIVCRTGDIDMAAMRARAFGLVDAWEGSLRRDPTMGVLGPSSTAALAVDVVPQQDTARTVRRLTVTLTYLSRA